MVIRRCCGFVRRKTHQPKQNKKDCNAFEFAHKKLITLCYLPEMAASVCSVVNMRLSIPA